MEVSPSLRAASRPAVAQSHDTFVWFSFLWAAAMLVHQVARHRTWMHPGSEHLIGWLLTLSALLVLFRPSSLRLFAIMLILDVANAFDRMPRLPNHILFNAMVSLTILITVAECAIRSRGRIDRTALFHRFAPLVRIAFIMLYLFAALAKLNTDYLNPQVSCGAAMYIEVSEHLHHRYGLSLPTGQPFLLASLWGALLLEIVLPIMLLLRGWRTLAIIVGITFHLALSLHPVQAIYSFSAMMFALYFLFAPDTLASHVKEQWVNAPFVRRWQLYRPSRVRTIAASWIGMLAAIVLIVVVATSGSAEGTSLLRQIINQARTFQMYLSDIGFHIFFSLAVAGLIAFIIVMRRTRLPEEPAREKFAMAPSAGMLVIGLILFNGLNPYLGLRTETAVAMFSNLRTEAGTTNHLFMPRWHIADYQDDVAEVLEFTLFGEDADVADDVQLSAIAYENVYVTWFDLRRRTSTLRRPFRIRYIHNGVEHIVDSRAEPDHILCQPHPFLAGKLLDFRIIDKDGPMRCRH